MLKGFDIRDLQSVIPEGTKAVFAWGMIRYCAHHSPGCTWGPISVDDFCHWEGDDSSELLEKFVEWGYAVRNHDRCLLTEEFVRECSKLLTRETRE